MYADLEYSAKNMGINKPVKSVIIFDFYIFLELSVIQIFDDEQPVADVECNFGE